MENEKMKVLGLKIKEARKERGLSQKEISKGICTQATISNIELKGECDSLVIFSSICQRLDLDVNECINHSEEYKLEQLLNEIEEMCAKLEHKKAWNILYNYNFGSIRGTKVTYARYNYYLGLTALIGYKKFSDSVFYLYRVFDYVKEDNIYYILAQNALGVLYTLQNDYEKAQTFYNRSIKYLSDYSKKHKVLPDSAYRIYFNSAKFYNLIENYNKGMKIAEKAIVALKKRKQTNYLDLLYYELASSKQMLHLDNAVEYKIAFYLAYMGENEELKKIIKKDCKEYDLSLDLE